MQVQYRETKGGFECIHIPSIDISSVPESAQSRPSNHRRRGSSGSNETGKTPRSLVKKASKLSFGVKSRDRESIKEKEPELTTPEKDLPNRPSVGTALSATPSSGSSSFFNVSSTAHTILADGLRHQDVNGTMTTVGSPLDESHTLRSHSPTKSKVLPPIPRDFGATAQVQAPSQPPTPRPTLAPFPTGEVDREVFEMMGANSMSVRFEINIIKVGSGVLLLFVVWMMTCLACIGPMVTAPWHSVSESGWGRVAVPDAGEESINGAQVVMPVFCFVSCRFVSPPPPLSFSLVLSFLPFESPIAICTTPGGDNMLSITHICDIFLFSLAFSLPLFASS